MLPTQRVAWVEGMLMEPQHFQQQERFMESLFHSRINTLGAYHWGVSKLEIDEGLLEQGKFALKHAAGVFPDGTQFAMPDRDPLPLPIDLDASYQNKTLCLAVLMDMPGNNWIDFTGQGASRYKVITAEIADRNRVQTVESLPRKVPVQLGNLQLRLCAQEATSRAETVIPVAKLGERMPDGRISLNSHFLPPMLDCRAAGWIISATQELQGLISQRLNAVYLPDVHHAGGGFSEMLEIMLLQTLGEYHLRLAHLLSRPLVHPETLYQFLLGLLGRLCFIPGSEAIRDRGELTYVHSQADSGFFQLFAALRRALSLVIESPAVALPFADRGDNIYVCQNDPQLRLEKLVFAVSADMPVDLLRSYFPAQVKLGPVEKISQLIDLQLPGLRILNMAAAPRHLPYYPDSLYFEVDTADPLYRETLSGAAIALSVVGDFPGLRFDGWGLRSGRTR